MPQDMTTTVSANGQVVLPKALRDAKRWPPGTRLTVRETPDGILLSAEPIFKRTTVEEAHGILKYDGPPVSVKEMDEAVSNEAARMWREFECDRD